MERSYKPTNTYPNLLKCKVRVNSGLPLVIVVVWIEISSRMIEGLGIVSLYKAFGKSTEGERGMVYLVLADEGEE